MFTAVVFDPGHQVRGRNGSLGWAANFDGYVNLLNLLDRLRARILPGPKNCSQIPRGLHGCP